MVHENALLVFCLRKDYHFPIKVGIVDQNLISIFEFELHFYQVGYQVEDFGGICNGLQVI